MDIGSLHQWDLAAVNYPSFNTVRRRLRPNYYHYQYTTANISITTPGTKRQNMK